MKVNTIYVVTLMTISFSLKTMNHQIVDFRNVHSLGSTNPNAQDHLGNTSLHYAWCESMAQRLIRNGADPCIKNNNGLLPEETVQTFSLRHFLKEVRLVIEADRRQVESDRAVAHMLEKAEQKQCKSESK